MSVETHHQQIYHTTAEQIQDRWHDTQTLDLIQLVLHVGGWVVVTRGVGEGWVAAYWKKNTAWCRKEVCGLISKHT